MSRQRRDRTHPTAVAARALLAPVIGAAAALAVLPSPIVGEGTSAPASVAYTADARPLGPLNGRDADDGSGGDAGGGCSNGCGGGLSGPAHSGREPSGSTPTVPVRGRSGRASAQEDGAVPATTGHAGAGTTSARDRPLGRGAPAPRAADKGPAPTQAEPAPGAGKVSNTPPGATPPPGVYLPGQVPPPDQAGYVAGGGPFKMGQVYLTHEQANNDGNILSLGGTALGVLSKPLGVITGIAGGIFKVADSSSAHGGAVLTYTPIPFLPVIPWAR